MKTAVSIISSLALGLALTNNVLANNALASTLASPKMTQMDDIDNWSNWSQVGQAQLSMFVFDIYQSQLLTPNGDYQISQDITPHPLALSITYQRDISQKQLLDATKEQWQKLGYQEHEIDLWATRLADIFPDIEQGNNLTYVTDGYRGQFYYSNNPKSQQVIGAIEEEAFNDAFLAIWLSPQTAYPHLRQDLIGRD